VGGLAAGVERRIDEGRAEHTPEGGSCREDGPARARELPGNQLALDFEADDKEEEHHQAVVDGVPEVLLDFEQVEVEGELRLPEAVVAVVPGRVHPNEGDDGADEEDDAARGFDGGEPLGRLHETPDNEAAAVAADQLVDCS